MTIRKYVIYTSNDTLIIVRGKSVPNQHPIPLEASTLFRNMPAGDSGGSQQVFVI
jgi:hypothetical protein